MLTRLIMWFTLRLLLLASIPYLILGSAGSDRQFTGREPGVSNASWVKMCRKRAHDPDRTCHRVEGRVVLISRGPQETKVVMISHYAPTQVIVDSRAIAHTDPPRIGRVWVAFGPRDDTAMHPVLAARHLAPQSGTGMVDRAVAFFTGAKDQAQQNASFTRPGGE